MPTLWEKIKQYPLEFAVGGLALSSIPIATLIAIGLVVSDSKAIVKGPTSRVQKTQFPQIPLLSTNPAPIGTTSVQTVTNYHNTTNTVTETNHVTKRHDVEVITYHDRYRTNFIDVTNTVSTTNTHNLTNIVTQKVKLPNKVRTQLENQVRQYRVELDKIKPENEFLRRNTDRLTLELCLTEAELFTKNSQYDDALRRIDELGKQVEKLKSDYELLLEQTRKVDVNSEDAKVARKLAANLVFPESGTLVVEIDGKDRIAKRAIIQYPFATTDRTISSTAQLKRLASHLSIYIDYWAAKDAPTNSFNLLADRLGVPAKYISAMEESQTEASDLDRLTTFTLNYGSHVLAGKPLIFERANGITIIGPEKEVVKITGKPREARRYLGGNKK